MLTSFSLEMQTVVEVIGYTVVLFLIMRGTSILVAHDTMQIYNPINWL